MPTEAEIRWNSRYRKDDRFLFESPRSLLIEHSELIPKSGIALDIAMGLGNNANYLIQKGLSVIGVDISRVALHKVKRKIPQLLAVVADLNEFYIPENKFDVILNFLYLQRDLWLSMIHGLKIGGVIFLECLTLDMLSIHSDINPTYLLKPGELQQIFSNSEFRDHLEIIYYFEGWQSTLTTHPRAVASLIARRVN
jgi:tellurite methyltransferase